MRANYAKTMILHCSVLHYNLWKKDPVGQNSFKRYAGIFDKIRI